MRITRRDFPFCGVINYIVVPVVHGGVSIPGKILPRLPYHHCDGKKNKRHWPWAHLSVETREKVETYKTQSELTYVKAV